MYTSIAFVLALVLLACGALVHLSTLLHEHGLQIRQGMTSVRAALSLKSALLEFSRASVIQALGPSKRQEIELSDRERRIIDWLNRSRKIKRLPEEERGVAEADWNIREYLRLRKAIAGKVPLRVAISQSSGALDAALASLDALDRTSVERADSAVARSSALDLRANRIAIVIVTLIFCSLIFIAFGTTRLIYRPLLSIYAAIREFSQKDKTSRAPVQGVFELNEVARIFNGLADQTVSLERQRANFLAGTAHDLRNPLTALKAAILMIKRQFNLMDEKRRMENLELIERQINRLEKMTSGFLDAIQVESGEFTLRLERVNLTQIVRDVVQLWSATTDKHELKASLPSEPLFLMADPVRIGQVITNIVNNAIKYSPQGGAIELVLSSTQDEALISVKDHGVGISRDDLRKIFEPFQRASSSRRLVPGVGIGLWVSKALIEKHHGIIEARSELNRGSEFVIRLPLKAQSAAA